MANSSVDRPIVRDGHFDYHDDRWDRGFLVLPVAQYPNICPPRDGRLQHDLCGARMRLPGRAVGRNPDRATDERSGSHEYMYSPTPTWSDALGR